jgi:tetratricopeptide (TPR) repeat protein
MRIQRQSSRLTFRKRRRRSGCLSLTVLLGLLTGIITISWNWFGQRLNSASSSQPISVNARGALDAFDRGDLDRAIDLAQQILAVDPNNAEALTLLIRALVYRSYSDYNRAIDRESALQITSEAASRSPRNMDIVAIHAFALQANGQPGAAAAAAQQVLENNPDHTIARIALALSYGGVGSYEISLRENLRAVEGTNWQMDARRALAISHSDLGDYETAIKTVERAISLNTHLTTLYFERALYALQIGDADAATVAYFQIIAYDPDNVKARLRLCELSSMMRERDAAIDYCYQVTELAPNWAEGWYRLGREYFLQGNFQPAQEYLHRCSSLQIMQDVPTNQLRFECWYLQGQAAEILGDCPGLVATYNEYLTLAADTELRQTWIYPPEGPPSCETAEAIQAAN